MESRAPFVLGGCDMTVTRLLIGRNAVFPSPLHEGGGFPSLAVYSALARAHVRAATYSVLLP